MQIEADRLKITIASGIPTKVVALGIGRRVSLDELKNMASAPVDRNVFHVHNFSSLSDVDEQVRNTSCTPALPSNSSMTRICNGEKSLLNLCYCHERSAFKYDSNMIRYNNVYIG